MSIKKTKLGKNVLIYDRSLVILNECTIGDDTKIHPFVVIQPGVKIGKRCKIQSFVFIPNGVEVRDEVFIGPHVNFGNDKYPWATGEVGKLKIVVEKGASLGANATILGGVNIGENSMVGAGAVVTKDVKANETVVGNPARTLRKR